MDTVDFVRAWTSPVRSAGNAIIQYMNDAGAKENQQEACPPSVEIRINISIDYYEEYDPY
jgi:hypothetical protein